MIRTIYFGTPTFAADVLRGLNATNTFQFELVVTGKSKPRGRHSLVPTPVATSALELGIPVFECDSPKDPALLEELQKYEVDLGIIVAWRILPESIYTLPKFGTVNLHGSLLPRYRGAAPIQRAIWNGESETGLTVFQLNKGVDTGGILLSECIPISDDVTAGDLFQLAVEPGIRLLTDSAKGIFSGTIQPNSQNDSLVSPAPKIKSEERWIDWLKPTRCVLRHIHALSPDPGAVTTLGGSRVLIYRTRVSDHSAPAEPGTIHVEKNNWLVRCGDGWLEILESAREGKKVLSGGEFARGIAGWQGKQFDFTTSQQS